MPVQHTNLLPVMENSTRSFRSWCLHSAETYFCNGAARCIWPYWLFVKVFGMRFFFRRHTHTRFFWVFTLHAHIRCMFTRSLISRESRQLPGACTRCTSAAPVPGRRIGFFLVLLLRIPKMGSLLGGGGGKESTFGPIVIDKNGRQDHIYITVIIIISIIVSIVIERWFVLWCLRYRLPRVPGFRRLGRIIFYVSSLCGGGWSKHCNIGSFVARLGH